MYCCEGIFYRTEKHDITFNWAPKLGDAEKVVQSLKDQQRNNFQPLWIYKGSSWLWEVKTNNELGLDQSSHYEHTRNYYILRIFRI